MGRTRGLGPWPSPKEEYRRVWRVEEETGEPFLSSLFRGGFVKNSNVAIDR